MRRMMVVAAAVLALAVAPAAARAQVKFGFYGTVGAGTADWESDWDSWEGDGEHDTTHTGFGLVFDAPVPGNIFGYRIGIGYEQADHEASFGVAGFDMHGIVIDQDLTFSFSPPPLRFWLGPELRLGFFRGESDAAPAADVDYIGLGIGPVFGLDMSLGPALALSWKAGYLITAYAGDDGGCHECDDDRTLVEGHGFLTLAILFRTWSGYPQQAPPQPY